MAFWHKHKWRVTAAQKMHRVTRHLKLGETSTPITEVVMVCDCGVFRTRTVDGHFEVADFRPAPHLPESDRKFLRGLGVKM